MNNFCLAKGVQVIGGKFPLVADGIKRELPGLRHGEQRLRAQAIRMQVLEVRKFRAGYKIPLGIQLVTVKNCLQGEGRLITFNGDAKGIIIGIAVEHILRQAEVDQFPGQKQLPPCLTLFRRAGECRIFSAGSEILLQEEQSLNHCTLARAVHARQQRQRAKVYPLALKALEIRQLHTVKHAAPPESACEFL